MVQYEHQWEQAQGGCLPEKKAWRPCHHELASRALEIDDDVANRL
jgi:hypothetical protein